LIAIAWHRSEPGLVRSIQPLLHYHDNNNKMATTKQQLGKKAIDVQINILGGGEGSVERKLELDSTTPRN
jgi:hypothetical protein